MASSEKLKDSAEFESDLSKSEVQVHVSAIQSEDGEKNYGFEEFGESQRSGKSIDFSQGTDKKFSTELENQNNEA